MALFEIAEKSVGTTIVFIYLFFIFLLEQVELGPAVIAGPGFIAFFCKAK
jgi:hypothetical protein